MWIQITWSYILREQFWIFDLLRAGNIGIKELDGAVDVKLGETVHNNLPGRQPLPRPSYCIQIVIISNEDGLNRYSG